MPRPKHIGPAIGSRSITGRADDAGDDRDMARERRVAAVGIELERRAQRLGAPALHARPR